MRPLFVTLSLICVLVPSQFCVLNENVRHIVEQLKEMMDRWSVNGQKERLLEFTYLRGKNQCNGDKSRLSISHQSFVVIERLSTLINKGV